MTARKTTTEKKKTIPKNAVIKKKPTNSAYAKKSEEEKAEIQALISIGLRKCTSAKEVLDDLKERGFKIAISTFYQYIKDIRAEWRLLVAESYETHVASQFAKLDLMEETLWKMLDKSMKSEKKDTINTEKGVIVGRKEETKTRNGDVEIMLAIERIWVRRNELLGITSSTINIQNNIQNNVTETTNVQNVEVTKVEFQPVADAFFGNFVIKQAERVK